MEKKYSEIWMALVHIQAKDGLAFNDLLDLSEDTTNQIYVGAFAQVLVKTKTRKRALEIIPLGMSEKEFVVVSIEGVKRLQPLVDKGEINISYIGEADWLLESCFIFKIADKLWTYLN